MTCRLPLSSREILEYLDTSISLIQGLAGTGWPSIILARSFSPIRGRSFTGKHFGSLYGMPLPSGFVRLTKFSSTDTVCRWRIRALGISSSVISRNRQRSASTAGARAIALPRNSAVADSRISGRFHRLTSRLGPPLPKNLWRSEYSPVARFLPISRRHLI